MSSCSWLLWIRDFIAWSALNLAECISTFKFVEVFFFVLVDGQAFRVVLFSIKSIWSIFRVCFKNCFSKPKHLCGFWSLRERRAQLARPSGPRLAPAGRSLPPGARSRWALAVGTEKRERAAGPVPASFPGSRAHQSAQPRLWLRCQGPEPTICPVTLEDQGVRMAPPCSASPAASDGGPQRRGAPGRQRARRQRQDPLPGQHHGGQDERRECAGAAPPCG